MRDKKTTASISDAFWEQVLPLLPPKVTGIEEEPPAVGWAPPTNGGGSDPAGLSRRVEFIETLSKS